MESINTSKDDLIINTSRPQVKSRGGERKEGIVLCQGGARQGRGSVESKGNRKMQGSEATMSLRGDNSGISQGVSDGHANTDVEMDGGGVHEPACRRSSIASPTRQSGSGFDFANASAEDAAEETKKLLRVVAASMVGNILEW